MIDEDPKKDAIQSLIPGYEVLRPNEKQTAKTFLNWFARCADQRELLQLCESAAKKRFNKTEWLKAIRELYYQNPEGRQVTEAIKKMVKMEKNVFLMITAKLEEVVALKSGQQPDTTSEKVRFEVSEEVKKALDL